MKIGIYGGSFNPVHYGHTGLMRWVLDNTDLDEIWMTVSPNNPLKDRNILGGEAERLIGAKEAITAMNEPRIRVSDFEFTLPRPSYTAATLKALREQYPEHEFVLIIGEDNWEIFDQWKDYEEILAYHTIYIYPRHHLSASKTSGHSAKRSFSEAVFQPKTVFQSKVVFQSKTVYLNDAPYFDISSTEIRNNCK